MTTLQLMDSDETTVLWDFDTRGKTSPNPEGIETFLGQDLNLGSIQTELNIFEPDTRPGGTVAKRRHPPVEMSFSMGATADNYDALVRGLGQLAAWLDNPPGPLRWIGDGEVRFIDLISSQEVVSAIRGQVLAGLAVKKGDTLEPIPVVLLRQPHLRGEFQVHIDDVAVPNDPTLSNGKAIQVTNPGNADMPVHLHVEADSGARMQEVLVAVYDRPERDDYMQFTKAVRLAPSTYLAWATTRENATSTTSDSQATGGVAAVCNFTGGLTHMLRRIRVNRTQHLDSLRGTFDVYLRGRMDHANNPSERLVHQLRWGFSLATASNSLPEVLHDTSGTTTFGYELINLGRVHIPEHAPLHRLVFEIWSRRLSGSGNMRYDYLWFVPVNRVTRLWIPGAAESRWEGGDLVTPVTNPSGGTAGTVTTGTNKLRLAASGDNCGTPPNTGMVLPAGRNRAHIHLFMGVTTGVARVRNISTSTTVASQAISFTASRRVITLEWDAAGGAAAYQVQVEKTSGGGVIDVGPIVQEFLPAVGAGEAVHAQPDEPGPVKVGQGGTDPNVLTVLAPMQASGPYPIWLPPGHSTLCLNYDDVKLNSAFKHGENVLNRTPMVMVERSPRYLL